MICKQCRGLRALGLVATCTACIGAATLHHEPHPDEAYGTARITERAVQANVSSSWSYAVGSNVFWTKT